LVFPCVGLSLNQIKTALQEYREKYEHQVFFIDKKGKILIQDEKSTDLTGNIKNIEGLSEVADKVLLTADLADAVNTFQYKHGGHSYVLNTRYIKELDLFLALVGDVDQEANQLKSLSWLNLAIWLLLTLGIMSILLWLINKSQEKFKHLAWHDPLTNVFNRQAFEEKYAETINSKTYRDRPISLLMIDIDNFKIINDQYGHSIGDNVIKNIASLLNENMGKDDILARWGGDEFCYLLPGKDIIKARETAEKLRLSIEKSTSLLFGRVINVSIGISERSVENDVIQSLDQHIDKADFYLYEAKRAGRNQIKG